MAPIQYLNTDLDLVSPIAFAPLADALKSNQLVPLQFTQGADGRWYAVFETREQYREPEPNIAKMLDAVESLSRDHRTLWDTCEKREFNIGYDCGDEPWAFQQGLTNGTLRRMAALGATLFLTLYPQREPTTDGERPHR